MTRAGTRLAICSLAVGATSSTRRTIADVLVFASGFLILLFVISASDERMRRDVWAWLSADRTPGIVADSGDRLSRIGGLGVDLVRQWSHLHPYLIAFALVACVILVAVRSL